MENLSWFTLPSCGSSPGESSRLSSEGIRPRVNCEASQLDTEGKYIGWGCLEHNLESVLMEDDVRDLRIKFTIPDEVELRVPNSGEIADNPCERWFAVYENFFDLDL